MINIGLDYIGLDYDDAEANDDDDDDVIVRDEPQRKN